MTKIIVVPVVVLVIITPILLIWLVMRRRKRKNNESCASPNEKKLLTPGDQFPKRPPRRGNLFRKPWDRPIGSRRQRMTFSGFDFDFPAPRSTRSSISTRSPRCVTRNEKRGEIPMTRSEELLRRLTQQLLNRRFGSDYQQTSIGTRCRISLLRLALRSITLP